jgi:Cu+-exporting ATPase
MSDISHNSAHSGRAAEHGHEHGSAHSQDHGRGASAGESTKDPVCGMSVDPATAAATADHAGRTYYFCSAGCRDKFVAQPQRYVG